MSKKYKNKQREDRRKAKRARKDANQAMYQKWAEEGRNQKSKRARQNSRGQNKASIRRREPTSTNVGCVVSHPNLNLPFLVWCRLQRHRNHSNQVSAGRRSRAAVSAAINANPQVWEARSLEHCRFLLSM